MEQEPLGTVHLRSPPEHPGHFRAFHVRDGEMVQKPKGAAPEHGLRPSGTKQTPTNLMHHTERKTKPHNVEVSPEYVPKRIETQGGGRLLTLESTGDSMMNQSDDKATRKLPRPLR